MEDLEQMSLHEKLAFLRNHKNWKCMIKWELKSQHASTWKQNGINAVQYAIAGPIEHPTSTSSIITVDVQLNNHVETDSASKL
jgi:hypothetical protein